MAKFDNKTFEITGTFGNISVYKMRGIERPIARTKGGATREKINKSPAFALTRMHNREFGDAACSAAAIRLALLHIRHLNDYNITPKLNGLCRTIMKYDEEHPLGYRHAIFSKHRHTLEGFSLNRLHTFDSVLRHPLACTLDRAKCAATIRIPTISPEFNFSLPWKFPMYRIIVGLGLVEDGMGVTGRRLKAGADPVYANAAYTPWQIASQQQEAVSLTVSARKPAKLRDSDTLLVSVGIEIGTPGPGGEIVPVKYTGCAKILMAG
jgi:hypothetical protein